MSSKARDSQQADLQQLWAGKVPPLTPEQVEVSLKLWQKIKARKQREREFASQVERDVDF